MYIHHTQRKSHLRYQVGRQEGKRRWEGKKRKKNADQVKKINYRIVIFKTDQLFQLLKSQREDERQDRSYWALAITVTIFSSLL